MKRALLAAVAATAIAGCGTTKIVTKTVTTTVTVTTPAVTVTAQSSSPGTVHFVMPPSQYDTSCTLYVGGQDVRVYVESTTLNVDPACRAIAQSQAAGGTLWQWQRNTVDAPTGDGQICKLFGAHRRAVIQVLDDGTAMYGTDMCTGLISAGWLQAAQ